MNALRWRRMVAPLLLSLLLASACAPPAPSRYEQTQQETTQRNAPGAVAKEATQGAKFNQFFPRSVSGYQIVPAQEKKGFAEYKVNRGGKNVAVLSISDTTGVAGAADKFQGSATKIAGYPAVEQGQNITAILVNGRYQVKVQSRDPSFTKNDRVAWIQKFNLQGLANLR
ncbi:hypothetical protein HJG54_23305 [Leptolyngbya sp. NK1-12]|uniref:Uncharacterized protein n=1 Tax=Leptolyngbya sp. NK1-12 TaxID=2547451 RepID=A0AA97AM85_9CYAN|nr:hypothetical protein [Leptolyngbya sp. NK1-12]WNZ25487.1 hypothetical protein HJG54_23305 [Leptolyngbya sp. NK1-12]